MEERYSDDFYQIIYSNDEKEIFEQCVRSYKSEHQLNFLKYLRNELSKSNLNNLFKDMMEGTPNLTEEKMEALDKKFDCLLKIKSSVLTCIQEYQSVEEENVKKNQQAVQNSLELEQKELIINSLYQRLNRKYINTDLENFNALLNSTNFSPVKWLHTDPELKALIDLLIRKLNFDFGNKVNIAITSRFYKVQGVPYNLNSIRKATGSPKYKQIVSNDPPHELFQIVEEIRALATNN
jgi:hypothetical protein